MKNENMHVKKKLNRIPLDSAVEWHKVEVEIPEFRGNRNESQVCEHLYMEVMTNHIREEKYN